MKGVLLVLASYLQVPDLHVTKAHLVYNCFLVLLDCDLEVGCGLKSRDIIGVTIEVPFNDVVPQVLTIGFDCLRKVCKEFRVPIDTCLESLVAWSNVLVVGKFQSEGVVVNERFFLHTLAIFERLLEPKRACHILVVSFMISHYEWSTIKFLQC